MRFPSIPALLTLGLLTACTGCSAIKPAELLDERSGMTVGALQEPIELVEIASSPPLNGTRRTSFAYLGPVEWDRSGEITYALWIHVAPGNDSQVADLRGSDAVTLDLDDGAVVLTPMDAPPVGVGPYRPVASWGQTAYFGVSAQILRRMAVSQKLELAFKGVDHARVDFLAGHETSSTLTQFLHARGITAD